MTANPFRILHVEDSPDFSERVREALGSGAYAFVYLRAQNEAEYLGHLSGEVPDAILCGHVLSSFDALKALELMQQRGLHIPFIVVCDTIDQSAVAGMQRGASDYLPRGELWRFGDAIKAAIDRGNAQAQVLKAQEALRASESAKRSILNCLSARLAMIDRQGIVREMNRAWSQFGQARPGTPEAAGIGDNYFDLLREAVRAGSGLARTLLGGIESVVSHEQPLFSFEYQQPERGVARWYRANAFPLELAEQGAVISYRDITEGRTAHLALDRANQRLRTLSKRVLSVQEDERRRISRELHDDIGQSLSALKIGLHRLAKGVAPQQEDLLSECLGVADATLDRLRLLALELRPPQLDQLGLADALQWMVERQRNTTGIDIRFVVSGQSERRPPAAIEAACFRIAQEALNNATCHAQAKSIVVILNSGARALTLTVRDDGKGFDLEAARAKALETGSFGLISMEERAELADGELKLHSVPGEGTTLTVTFRPGAMAEAPAWLLEQAVP